MVNAQPVWTPDRPILEVKDLRTWFPIRSGPLGGTVQFRAVDGVDLAVWPGRTLGLVGESGCGKTTLGRSILRLIEPTSGAVLFKGTDLTRLSNVEMRRHRRYLTMIFQDPFASLDPRQTVGAIIGEPIDIHHLAKSRREKEQRVGELLDIVGLSRRYRNRYPLEFSGGQRQRIGIARSLAVRPSLVICDEPVSALDVSIQAQIVNLLEDLQDQLNLTYLFIAHDLSLVKHISDHIAVMYLGKIVEVSPAKRLYSRPYHPYTASLLSAIPIPDPVMERERRRIILSGDLPSPLNPPSGCRFRTRCYKAQAACAQAEPPLVEHGTGAERRKVACFFPLNQGTSED